MVVRVSLVRRGCRCGRVLYASLPVRVALAGAGWLRHMALGWRGRTPWTTPTNGGSHSACGLVLRGLVGAIGWSSASPWYAGDAAAAGCFMPAAYGPRVEGPDPVDNADERRIPQGGFLQESR
jgi:hypothetical protein